MAAPFSCSSACSFLKPMTACIWKILREAASLFSNKPLKNALLHAKSEIEVCELIHNWTPPSDLHYEQDFSDDEDI